MIQPIDPLAPAIGACLPCRSLFLVTPETPNCILCGQPPAYTLPFSYAPRPLITREEAIALLKALGISREEAEKTLGPEEPAVEPIPSAVPSTELAPAADVSPAAAGEEPPEELAPAGTGTIAALVSGMYDFLVGTTEGSAQVYALFLEAHAEREEASIAVGRLVAVREFVDTLWDRFEAPPAVSEEPQPETSAGEG